MMVKRGSMFAKNRAGRVSASLLDQLARTQKVGRKLALSAGASEDEVRAIESGSLNLLMAQHALDTSGFAGSKDTAPHVGLIVLARCLLIREMIRAGDPSSAVEVAIALGHLLAEVELRRQGFTPPVIVPIMKTAIKAKRDRQKGAARSKEIRAAASEMEHERWATLAREKLDKNSAQTRSRLAMLIVEDELERARKANRRISISVTTVSRALKLRGIPA